MLPDNLLEVRMRQHSPLRYALSAPSVNEITEN